MKMKISLSFIIKFYRFSLMFSVHSSRNQQLIQETKKKSYSQLKIDWLHCMWIHTFHSSGLCISFIKISAEITCTDSKRGEKMNDEIKMMLLWFFYCSKTSNRIYIYLGWLKNQQIKGNFINFSILWFGALWDDR